ncbi:MAG: BBP7 family outer membrane beta-barrel protein [Gemmataceae bacterium]
MFPPAYRHAAQLDTPKKATGSDPVSAVPQSGVIIATSSSTIKPVQMTVEDHPENVHGGEQFAMDQVLREKETQLTGHQGKPSMEVPGTWSNSSVASSSPVIQSVPAQECGTIIQGSDGVSQGNVLAGHLLSPDLEPTQYYLRGEYLLWWLKPDQAPPLATTGPVTDGNLAGALGRPGTIILNDGTLDRNSFSGFRAAFGYYLDDCATSAIELNGFFLGSRSSRFSTDSVQHPVLTRPFFNLNQQEQSIQRVAFPGQASGRLTIEAPTELWGVGLNYSCLWHCGCDYRIDPLFGARFLNLRESLTITEDIQNLPGQPDPFNGTRVIVQDRFVTSNQFYGAVVGVQGVWQRERLTLEGRASLGLGVTQQQLEISGYQQFPPGTPNVEDKPGGLYALDSNIGKYSRGRFTVLPEIGVNVGYYVTDYLRALVGYNFLYWSNVARPGQQIDPNLDITRIPNFDRPPGTIPYPMPRPAVLFKDSDFWAHGLTFGLEYRY